MNPIFLGALLLQAQLASVEGVVVKPDGLEPLGRTRVTLTPVVRGAILAGPSGVTEDDGHFLIRDIPPGEYQIGVDTLRYGYVLYGQRHAGGPAMIFKLEAGQHVRNVNFRMPETGAISGRITGRNGEPAVKASVQALSYGYQKGRRTLKILSSGTTDDRGEYRLFGLPSGSYLVAAVLNEFAYGPHQTGLARSSPVGLGPAFSVDGGRLITIAESMLMGTVVHRVLEDGTVQDESWAPLYYPATTEARFAVPIEVEGGATRTGIDISIGPSRVLAIRGRLTGAVAPGPRRVTLSPQIGAQTSTFTATQSNGAFEFSGVLPGLYYLSAFGGPDGLVTAPLQVEVSGRDIDNLQIALVPGVNIGVTIYRDDPSGLQPVSGVGAVLSSEIPGALSLSTNGQSQTATGRVSIANVPPGNYQVQIAQVRSLQIGDLLVQGLQVGDSVNSLPEAKRFHIKSVRFGGRDASEGIQVDAGSPSLLEIVVTTDSGSVKGSVTGAGQGAVPGATVVLVPENGKKREELYGVTISDSAGAFHFDDVAPGDYRLFAWEDVETGAWQDLEFLRNFEAQSRRVTISGNASLDVPLTLIQKP